MSTSSEFENRRRERRRRERLRKKRIRAAVLLIAFIGIIVIICVAFSTCKKKSTPDTPAGNGVTEVTAEPAKAPPTALPQQSSASGIPPASEQNDLLEIINDSGQDKRCYLTFDDGPTKNITPQVLDVLRRYNVKATFFEVGSLIEANPDIARRVYEEGHLIANHSDGHNYEKLYASTETFINEINECYEIIKTVTDGEEPFKLVRFPGGSYKSSADSFSPVKQECKTKLKEYGFYYCDWNSLTGDAEGRKKDADGLLEYLQNNIDTDESAVVLMHDAAAKQATADALPAVIEYLMSEGYTFHRLDEIDYQSAAVSASPETSSDSDSDNDSDSDSDSDSDNDSRSSSPTPTTASKTSSTSKPTSQPSSNGAIIIQ